MSAFHAGNTSGQKGQSAGGDIPGRQESTGRWPGGSGAVDDSRWGLADVTYQSFAAAFIPVVVAAALVPLRDDMINANVALALMAVVVCVAAAFGRSAGAVAAVSSALAYDFFHTRPYLSLRMTSWNDVETTALLLLVGLVMGTLTFRSARDRAATRAGRHDLRRIQRLADHVVAGEDPAEVILAAEAELTGLLDLADCRFVAQPYGEGVLVRLERGDRFGLPAEGAELEVLVRGRPAGRFVLTPNPGAELSLEQRVVAVALADQVGASLATSNLPDDRRSRAHA